VFFSTDPRGDRPRAITGRDFRQSPDFCVCVFGLPASELPFQFAGFAHVEIFDAWFGCQNSFPSHAEIGPNRVSLHAPCEKKGLALFITAGIVEVRFKHDQNCGVSIRFRVTAHHRIQHFLTFRHHCALLQSRSEKPLDRSTAQRCSWRITPRLRQRIPQVISASSRTSCGDLWPCRTPKLKPNSMPRNEQRRGSLAGLPLPALPAPSLRTPFLPPCQSPPRRLIASQQSVIRLDGIYRNHSTDCL
jgi:hypothetical protein